jgi:hypothetical protein
MGYQLINSYESKLMRVARARQWGKKDWTAWDWELLKAVGQDLVLLADHAVVKNSWWNVKQGLVGAEIHPGAKSYSSLTQKVKKNLKN